MELKDIVTQVEKLIESQADKFPHLKQWKKSVKATIYGTYVSVEFNCDKDYYRSIYHNKLQDDCKKFIDEIEKLGFFYSDCYSSSHFWCVYFHNEEEVFENMGDCVFKIYQQKIKKRYRNIPDSEYTWRGNVADPLVTYKGKEFSYWDCEDYLWHECKYATNIENPDEIFESWICENHHKVQEMLDLFWENME